jgi:hypothetical protein
LADYAGCLVFIGIFLVPALLAGLWNWAASVVQKVRTHPSLVRDLEVAAQRTRALEGELSRRNNAWETINAERAAVRILAEQKSQGFPWLAEAYADYFHLQSLREADAMAKKHPPAPRSAERLREVAGDRRTVERKLRMAQGIIGYYQELFPFLEDFLGDIDDELLRSILDRDVAKPIRDIAEVGVDPVRLYLSREEYDKLSPGEKNQLALDRYWQRRRSRWEIGRDYERYIGYIYECDAWAVSYQGILEGLEDLGRDLVCKQAGHTQVVQCKCWSEHRQIHEKHITQLFGTTVKYEIEHPGERVTPVLFTSTVLSDRAREFAAHLDVVVREQVPLVTYPSVKCNVSRRTGERIYHLPFDQMYDRTLIEEERNECYVSSATEAEELGFRRAWRWTGDKGEVEV